MIKGYEEYQSKLVEVIQPFIQFHSDEEKEEFRKIINNTLHDLDGPRSFSSPPTRRDHVFIGRLFLEFNEIVSSYLSLKDIEIYIRRFPYRDTGVSPLRYMKYHIESHLNEIYIFKERFERHLTFIQRRYRKSTISEDVSEATENIRTIMSASLKDIISIRGEHVHERRFSDKDLERLEFLEMLTKNETEHDFLLMSYDLAYKEIRKKWVRRITQYNDAIKLIFDRNCQKLHAVLFDDNGDFIFPDV